MTEDVKEISLTIHNQKGLHARAAAKFVNVTSKFESEIKVSKEDLAELQNADAPQSNEAPAEEGGQEESNEVSLDEIAENDQQEADNSENSEQ